MTTGRPILIPSPFKACQQTQSLCSPGDPEIPSCGPPKHRHAIAVVGPDVNDLLVDFIMNDGCVIPTHERYGGRIPSPLRPGHCVR